MVCAKERGTFSRSAQKEGSRNMAEIKSEVVKEIGILSTSKSNWNREVNIIRWNDGKPKLDIRDWAPEHERAGKGITLTAEEVAVLKELLADYDPYEFEE